MGRRSRIFPKDLCHRVVQALLLTGSKTQLEPLCKEDVCMRTEYMPQLKLQSRTKLSPLSNPKMMPEPLPSLYLKHRETDEKLSHVGNCSLPCIDHQTRAKPTLDHKSHSRTNVLPTLCPEHRTRPSALSLPTPGQCITAPFISNLLDEARLNPVRWAKALLGPEYFLEIPQVYEHKTEHLPNLSHKPTLPPVTDHSAEASSCPYPWTGTKATPPQACPSPQDKALLYSKNGTEATTSLSQSFSHHHKSLVTPLPTLNQGSRATAVIISGLIPCVQGSTEKASQDNSNHRVIIPSLQSPDNLSVVKDGSSLQTNHYSKVTPICPPHPKYWNKSISSESLRYRAIARASSSPILLTRPKTLPSVGHKHSIQDIGDLSLSKSEVTLPCYKLIPETSLGPYKSKTTPRSSPYPDVQDTFLPNSGPSASVPITSDLNNKVTNSSEAFPWKKALPFIKCNTMKVPISNNQTDVTPQGISHQDESAVAWAIWPLSDTDLSLTIPSDLDHHSELSKDSAHQDIPSICANTSSMPYQKSLATLSRNSWTKVKLRPSSQDTSSLRSKHQKEAVLEPLPPMGQDYPATPSVDLNHQTIVLPTQVHQIPTLSDSNHQITLLSSPDHHTKDKLNPNIQGTLKSTDDHWESMPLEQVHQDILQPDSGHYTDSTGNSSAQITLKVFPFQWKTKTVTNKENPVISLLDKDPTFDSIKESNNNNQSRTVTDLEKHKTPIQDPGHCPIPIPHPRPESLTSCNSLAKAALSTNHQDEAQSINQHKIQTLQNTEAMWCFNHIKPYIIEGKTVIPATTIKDIISSIPQEKIKKDIYKQILLRRMRGTTHRPGRRISSSYKVCLTCASWVPNGCPHIQGTKYLCQAQLLAIPMPLPGSEEEMGVKFVLQMPQTKKCSIFNITSTVCTLKSLMCFNSLIRTRTP